MSSRPKLEGVRRTRRAQWAARGSLAVKPAASTTQRKASAIIMVAPLSQTLKWDECLELSSYATAQ